MPAWRAAGLKTRVMKLWRVEGRAGAGGEEVAVRVRRAGELLLAEEPERAGPTSTVRRPARVFVCDAPAVLALREDGDRAALEVDVAVAEAEDLAAAQHGQDRDRDDPARRARASTTELVGLVPGEEPRLTLLGSRDPDAVDGGVDLLAALLGSP